MYLISIFFRCSSEERLLLLPLSFQISLNKYFENMYADFLFFCHLATLKKVTWILACLKKSHGHILPVHLPG